MATTVSICMYRSLPLVPFDSCLSVAACLSSACYSACSQASDLALLVGYVAYIKRHNKNMSEFFTEIYVQYSIFSSSDLVRKLNFPIEGKGKDRISEFKVN